MTNKLPIKGELYYNKYTHDIAMVDKIEDNCIYFADNSAHRLGENSNEFLHNFLNNFIQIKTLENNNHINIADNGDNVNIIMGLIDILRGDIQQIKNDIIMCGKEARQCLAAWENEFNKYEKISKKSKKKAQENKARQHI